MKGVAFWYHILPWSSAPDTYKMLCDIWCCYTLPFISKNFAKIANTTHNLECFYNKTCYLLLRMGDGIDAVPTDTVCLTG